jgi:uncharacterized repeat protein (TIGR02543 family)
MAVLAPFASAAGAITQIAPTSGTVDVAGSAGFTDTLAVSGNVGAVTYVTSPLSTHLTVSGSGGVSTTGPLAAGAYTVSGTDSDTNGDSGAWTYKLTVTDTIVQGAPTSGTVDVAGSAGFTDTLAVSGNVGAVTYVTSPLSTHLTVSGSGGVSTTGPLAAGAYTVSGTDSDTNGDSGAWTYKLTVNGSGVNGNTITQTSPTSGVTATTASATLQPVPITVVNNTGPVTFAVTSPPDGLTLSGNQISTTGSLALGVYKISGTDRDTSGATGTWTYTLTVSNAITQTSPTTGATTTTASSTFAPGPITVVNNTGSVTFVTTVSSTGLKVSGAGVITTTGALVAGSYTVSGTDRDASGNAGVWTYTLTVNNRPVTVFFTPNGGRGSMSAQRHAKPEALKRNSFTRSGYSFVNWNTAANGSGVSYANGTIYPFKTRATLYAQWRVGKAARHSVTFHANGGTGSMAAEHDNRPTALSNSLFTRAGYTFTSWNTKANGSGASYTNGARYSFKASVTLYAQWKKVIVKVPAFTVNFNAHGGRGSMSAQRHAKPEALKRNSFTRSGYSFVNWNTAANGSGASYTNGAAYSFAASTTLYAQWKKNKKIPAPPTGPTIGPFALGSSTLSPALESKIQNVADEVKAKRDTQLALLGYGDKLTAARERNKTLVAKNIELGRMRAEAVATYLQGRLAALGLKGWTISISAAGSSQSEIALVIATLS